MNSVRAAILTGVSKLVSSNHILAHAGARVRARRKWPVSGESGRRFMIQ